MSLTLSPDALVDGAHPGLTSVEARQRLAADGPNALPEAPPRPTWLRFVDQFRNLLIVVLVGAAVLAGLVGDWKDTIVISIVLLLNAGTADLGPADWIVVVAVASTVLVVEEVRKLVVRGRREMAG